ncbi:MAG TPA: sugar kinase [Solirubrobacteraceae bacterium]
MSEPLDAVTLGEAMVLLLGEPALPLAASRHYRRSVAGAESNVAIGLARLGHRTGFIGRVGADVFGRVVLSTLRAEGVDVSQLRLDDAPTGLLVRDCAGERPSEVVYHRRGSAGSMLSPEDVQREYVADARLFHVSGVTGLVGEHPRAAALKAMRIAADAGALVSFDPNIRERLCPREQAAELLRPLAGEAHLVLAAEDEAVLLSGCAHGEDAAEWLIEHGARMVVIKRGVEGAWATDGAERWDQASWPVRAVDTVGAGDAFAAGLLSALLRGAKPPRALAEGAVVAALCVSAPGDIDGLPTAAERDALLAGGAEVRR